nr:Fic family protein [uncultured Acetatifactor sp.]
MEGGGNQDFAGFLSERFRIERERFDRSGVYAYTQRLLAYNSNKIEGSTLTEEQTASLFDNGTLPRSEDYYRAKDVEEMNGHFLMFNKMLDTIRQPLSSGLIKQFHYELKSGVFEDRANGYAIGDYKKRPNMIGIYQTVRPENVEAEMDRLMEWYHGKAPDIAVFAEFHARYESIHPFQDDGVIIGTRLEKPSKINGFALLSPNFFMPERENGITSLLHILLASSMKV